MILHAPEDKRRAAIGRTATKNSAASTHGDASRKDPSRDFHFAHLVGSGCDLGRLVHTETSESEAIGACVRVSGSGKGSSECAVALGKALAARYDEYRDRQFGTFASGGERALTSADALCRRRRG